MWGKYAIGKVECNIVIRSQLRRSTVGKRCLGGLGKEGRRVSKGVSRWVGGHRAWVGNLESGRKFPQARPLFKLLVETAPFPSSTIP